MDAKNKKATVIKKIRKLNISQYFKKLIENALITAGIIGVIGYFFSSYINFRNRVLGTYDSLAHSVEACIFSYESLYTLCKQMSSNNEIVPNCKYLKTIDLYKIQQTFSDQFSRIYKNMDALGKMMSYDSYVQLHNFNYWTNATLTTEKGMCESGLLVSHAKMDMWRDEILKQLLKDKEDKKKISVSLKYYILNIFTDIEIERYTNFPVNLNHLPINKSTNPS
jgi:hypothetical protein